jgi:tetratricopeptide (TPR) repeat protein
VPTTEARTVVLMVDAPERRTNFEILAEKRLRDRDFEVCVQGQGTALPADKEIALVVVCQKDPPATLRTTKLPVVVCNPDGLYDLGMTLGTENVDFGATAYSSVFIGSDAGQHPLTGDLTGRRQVTPGRQEQGWAKPGVAAAVAATVGGDRSKAVIFGYAADSLMATCKAVQRRVGLLTTGGEPGQLTEQGWHLFDAAVDWAINGSGPTNDEAANGFWFLKDGTPTRALSSQEYRDWVHEKVETRLWNSVLRFYGLIGFGGLAAVGALAMAIFHWAVQVQHQDHMAQTKSELKRQKEDSDRVINEKFSNLQEVIDKTASREATSQVSKLVLRSEDALLKKVLEEEARSVGKRVITQQVMKDEIRGQIVAQLLSDGSLSDVLIERIQKEKSPEMQRLILKVAMSYAEPETRQRFRKKILAFVVPTQDERVRAAALEVYLPTDNFVEAVHDIDHVLGSLAHGEYVTETQAHELISSAASAAYSGFFAGFSEDRAKIILTWLVNNYKTAPAQTRTAILDGVVRMQPAAVQRQDSPSVLEQLIELAKRPGQDEQKLGIVGLTRLAAARPKLTAAARQQALQALLVGMDQDERLSAELAGKEGNVISVHPVLQSLVLPDDWPVLRKMIKPGLMANVRSFQALLINWQAQVRKAPKGFKLPAEMFTDLLDIDDVLHGKGSAPLVELAVASGGQQEAETFLERFPKRFAPYRETPPKDAAYGGDGALRQAIRRDAERRDSPFQATIKVLNDTKAELLDCVNPEMTKEDQKKLADRVRSLRQAIKAALTAYFEGRFKQLLTAPTDVPMLMLRESTLVTPAQTEESIPADLAKAQLHDAPSFIARCYETAFGSFTGNTSQPAALGDRPRFVNYFVRSNPDLYIAAYSLYFRSVVGTPERYVEQAALLGYQRRYREAEESASRAVKIDPKQPAYHEFLGDLRLEQPGKAPTAVEDYRDALKVTATGLSSRRSELYRKAILACAIAHDERMAAELEAQAKKEKASVADAMSLLYLAKDPQEALKRAEELGDNATGQRLSLNWAVRYLAYRSLPEPNPERATAALQNWDRLPWRLETLLLLNRVVPELVDKYFSSERFEDRLLKRSSDAAAGTVADDYRIELKAGNTYLIDMESRFLDSYLVIYDSKGKVCARDDDSGGNLNARIRFPVTEDGKYVVQATSLSRQNQGPYLFMIRQQPKDAK